MPVLLLLSVLLLSGCSATAPGTTSPGSESTRGPVAAGTAVSGTSTPDFVDAPGVIGVLDLGTGEALFYVAPDASPSNRYCLPSERLPEALRADGAAVVFTGNREEIPANYRLACAPFELLEIAARP